MPPLQCRTLVQETEALFWERAEFPEPENLQDGEEGIDIYDQYLQYAAHYLGNLLQAQDVRCFAFSDPKQNKLICEYQAEFFFGGSIWEREMCLLLQFLISQINIPHLRSFRKRATTQGHNYFVTVGFEVPLDV